MNDGDALLKAILAHPEEDTPRLIYADWLQENGQHDRAEFIRLMCRPNMPHVTLKRVERGTSGWDITSGPAGVVCNTKMNDVARRITAYLLPFVTELTIHRGFVMRVACTIYDWTMYGDSILAAHPIRSVTLPFTHALLRDRRYCGQYRQWLYYRWPSVPRHGWRFVEESA